MIEEGITAYLKTYTPLVVIQGTRVWPDILPETPELPATTFISISDPSSYTHTGEAMKEQRFQFDCWAKDPLTAIRLKNTIRQAFSGFRGMMGSTEVYAAFPENSRPMDDDETGLYRRIIEVLFHYKEA